MTPVSNGRICAARTMAVIAVPFLMFDVVGKVLTVPPVVQGTTSLGYQESHVLVIGLIELACLAVYLVPRTAVLGAVLLTGYLGGAVATHLRVGSPAFTHTLFPIYIGALVWGALVLRDGRLRLFLLREQAPQPAR